MTDDITLPTTPNRTLLRRVMPDDYRYGDIYGYTIEQMRSYARAAVEADRQRRGESAKVPSDEILTAVIHYGDCRFNEREATDKRDAADRSAQAYADICGLLSRYGQPAASAESASLFDILHQAAISHLDSNGIATDAQDLISLIETLVTAVQDAAPVAQEPPQVTDAEIEKIVTGAGARWDGSVWKVEDADLHPMARALLYRYTTAPVAAQPVVTDEMVSRFLGWHLPQDFIPESGISFNPPNNSLFWPVGTNLFTASQARAMLEYVLLGVQK